MLKTHSSRSRAYGIVPPGFRLPDAAHVGTVHLLVSDLTRSLAYYRELIGLRALATTPNAVTLAPHGDDRPLVTLRTSPGVQRARRGAFGLYHFAILLPDRAALGRFATYLSSQDVRVGMADHLVSEAFYLWDPDGLGIEVYADRPRESWRHQDRELTMATDPLDIDSLAAAAGGAAWTGAPPGTTIGHMHLHVGSLEAADGFYHRALGFDKTVWRYPGALFMSAGGYHHHLATNVWSPGPAPSSHDARLLEWELVLPSNDDVAAAGRSVRAAGYTAGDEAGTLVASDPWGTRVRIRAA
jgi:catechol 2,3-dioxygenase